MKCPELWICNNVTVVMLSINYSTLVYDAIDFTHCHTLVESVDKPDWESSSGLREYKSASSMYRVPSILIPIRDNTPIIIKPPKHYDYGNKFCIVLPPRPHCHWFFEPSYILVYWLIQILGTRPIRVQQLQAPVCPVLHRPFQRGKYMEVD